MNTSVTIQNLDAATATWLFAEAQRQNQSVEALILKIIQKELHAKKNAVQPQTSSLQVERHYAEAYAKFPVRAGEFEIDESQLTWEEE